MDAFYLVVFSNGKTNEQLVFCAFMRDDADVLKDAFLKSVDDPSDWHTFVFRSVVE